jgi:putative salt-induced outer membrane protein YdiY
MLRRQLLMLALWLGVQPAAADVITLTNGDRLTGSVVSIQDGTVIFDAIVVGRVSIKLVLIEQLETEHPAQIRLASGDQLNGRLVILGDAQALETDESVKEISVRDIQQMAKNRIRPVDLGRGWRNAVDVNASIATGNTDIESFRARAESLLRLHDREHAFTLHPHYQEPNDLATRHQGQFGYDYRWFFRDDWFLVGSGEYFQDRIRGISERISVSAGAGHRFWENTLGKLSLEVSAGATHERIDKDQEVSPALRWALDYNRLLFANQIEVFHRNRILRIFEEDRGTVLSFSTGFRYALNERWKATLHVDMEHETRPPGGRSRTDMMYGFGIGVRF